MAGVITTVALGRPYIEHLALAHSEKTFCGNTRSVEADYHSGYYGRHIPRTGYALCGICAVVYSDTHFGPPRLTLSLLDPG